jgi:hypothetical protein
MATGSVVRSDAATANAVDVLDPFYTEPSALHRAVGAALGVGRRRRTVDQ